LDYWAKTAVNTIAGHGLASVGLQSVHDPSTFELATSINRSLADKVTAKAGSGSSKSRNDGDATNGKVHTTSAHISSAEEGVLRATPALSDPLSYATLNGSLIELGFDCVETLPNLLPFKFCKNHHDDYLPV
jgi:hypothetical protein